MFDNFAEKNLQKLLSFFSAKELNKSKYFFIVFQRKKDLMFQVNPLQRIHTKHQALFSSEGKSEKIKVSSAAIFV